VNNRLFSDCSSDLSSGRSCEAAWQIGARWPWR